MRWFRVAVLVVGLVMIGDCGPGTPSPEAAAPVTRAPVLTTTTAPPSPTVAGPAQLPHFLASIKPVTAADLYASWHPGCPVAPAQLRAVEVSYVGVDGAGHTGRLVVAVDEAQPIADVFAELYAARFPIARMEPIDVFGGDDSRSISANNTSAFNCRLATGGTGWSEHAYGRAIDINPLVNPYVRGTTVLPAEAARYVDRTRADPGMIHDGDLVVRALAARGWRWGGSWRSLKDYQHFSTTGR